MGDLPRRHRFAILVLSAGIYFFLPAFFLAFFLAATLITSDQFVVVFIRPD
jgi:hypothetical protein